MMKINKVIILAAALCCAALSFAGCKKQKKIVYLNPFEGREYYTEYSNGYKLSMIFTDETHAEFIVPVRGKLRDFTYTYNAEKCELYLKSTAFYDADGKSVSHKEFLESLSDNDKSFLRSDSVRVDYPEITFSYYFDPEGDEDNKLELTQIYTDIDSATFAVRTNLKDMFCYGKVDYDYDSSLTFYNSEHAEDSDTDVDEHFLKSVERSCKASRKQGKIRFECTDPVLVEGSDADHPEFTEETHSISTKFKVLQKDGVTQMKLTFIDGEFKGESIIMDFYPETLEFEEGRWL